MQPKPNTTETPSRFVIKASGQKEVQSPEKLKRRIENLLFGLSKEFIRVDVIVSQMMDNMQNNIETSQIDSLLSETCAYLNMLHPDYSVLAARVAVSKLHKDTKDDFADFAKDLFFYKDKAGKICLLRK